MGATYQIRSSFIDEQFSIELSKNQFLELRDSRKFLIEYMHFEECFMQMAMCLEDFEIFLLRGAQSYLLFPFTSYDFFQDQRVKANTKVLSFLNSMTSFRDQAPRLNHVVSKGGFRKKFRDFWNEEISLSTAFSFCDHLRNYAQHQTQPVDSVTVGGGWNKERTISEHHTTVYVSVAKVCNDRKMTVLERQRFEKDLKRLADLALIIRESAGCVGKIVKKSRDELKDSFELAVENLNRWLEETSKYGQGKLSATVEMRDELATEKFDLFPDFVSRAKRLRHNLVLSNAEAHIVSNRARGHKE